MSQVIFQNVTGNIFDSLLFVMLEKTWQDNINILELIYLLEINDNDTFKAKSIIYNMVQKHVHDASGINNAPHLLITYCYQYSTNESNTTKIEISNNMPFYKDVALICVLYYAFVTFGFEKYETAYHLTTMMNNKYATQSLMGHEATKIFLNNIAFSFSSVIFDIYYNDKAFPIMIANIFPGFNSIPAPMFLPMIFPILPRLRNFPIAILMAISIKLATVFNLSMFSLDALYNFILTCNACEIFPESLRITICEKYNIVVKLNNEYKFAHYFIQYREKAKELISMLRVDDPSLQHILTLI